MVDDSSIGVRFRRLVERTGWMLKFSALRAAAAGRAAAARVLPKETPPTATDRLLALVPRVSALAAGPDLPPLLAERVAAVEQALGAALAAAEMLQTPSPDPPPPPPDRRHPLAAAARQALQQIELAPAGIQPVARRAVHALLHPSAAIRTLALRELTRQRARPLVPLLEALYRRAAAPERQAVLGALRALGANADGAALRIPPSAQRAPDRKPPPAPAGRRTASSTPADANAPAAIRRGRLESALTDPSLSVRLRVVRSATERPDPALVLPLLRALLDTDLEVRKAAVRAISTIVGFDITFDAHAGEPVRRAAVSALRRWWAQARCEELASSATRPPTAGGEGELHDPLRAEYELAPGGEKGPGR